MSDTSDITTAHLVEIDRNKCCGYGICVELCPEVFALDENGFVVLNMTEIPDELLATAEDAAYSCPEEVITVHRSGEPAE
ncbi:MULTISPECIES: ferredoxin [Mycolicibacter]|uniref:Ferredoxin n=1 Tax=Mycolicibacter kumamotonensis TaxID=354243 RepID=A0A7K3L6A8_9MYCO|nr:MULTISPECIES: ferredoxin [Mycolicibacter]NDJ87958.1 ferredoxin [Mycolicibacter kumamotonensis]RAV03863.1 ferredoxin [Mycolicibacter senuensis]